MVQDKATGVVPLRRGSKKSENAVLGRKMLFLDGHDLHPLVVKMKYMPGTKDIPTQIKDPDLVERRHRQIVDAAVQLFIKNGFHKTTTRQIARAAGFSIGSLYEYITSKEDILYLVCDAIHAEVERGVTEAMSRATEGHNSLAEVIREYFLVCNRMSDHVLLIYQETQSLPPQWRKRVLENEVRITGIFMEVLANLISSGELPNLNEGSMELIAHNISVLGHMWTFRRWFLARHYSIEDYIELQTKFILGISSENHSHATGIELLKTNQKI